MISVEFIYNGNNIIVQSDLKDKLKDIIRKYISKSLLDRNSLTFFYSGKIIDEDLKLFELINEEKKISIIVNSVPNIKNIKSIKKSRYIICPICNEDIKYKIFNYKIFLYECKNGHRINNILLNEFEKTQYIDISKIICNICKYNNKSNTFNNEFYKCLTCDINICPSCRYTHDNLHNIINYDQKNYLCKKHNDFYVKYCYKCKMNICLICENEHKNHNNIYYGEIVPNDNENKKYLKELRNSIDLFKNNIKDIINKLNKTIDNIEIYYNIINNIINNYNIKNRN